MNELITASIGLYKDKADGKYYLQVIPADTQNNNLIEIPTSLAMEISEKEDLKIVPINSSLGIRCYDENSVNLNEGE